MIGKPAWPKNLQDVIIRHSRLDVIVLDDRDDILVIFLYLGLGFIDDRQPGLLFFCIAIIMGEHVHIIDHYDFTVINRYREMFQMIYFQQTIMQAEVI